MHRTPEKDREFCWKFSANAVEVRLVLTVNNDHANACF
jgi:hypothetical protein